MFHRMLPGRASLNSPGDLAKEVWVMRRYANIIGPTVIKFRHQRGWTQEELVTKLQLVGCYITRDVLANIEVQRSVVTDIHIRAFAEVFRIAEADLFPPKRQGIQSMWLVDQITARRRRRSGDGSLPDGD
jgi:transcriptional regulator with XRE-family HTH domain